MGAKLAALGKPDKARLEPFAGRKVPFLERR
jgi:hypothetical protein